MMTRYEREIIAKYDRYKAQWWLLSPKELRELLEDVMSILRWCIDFVKTVNGQYVILPKGNISEEEYDLIKKFLM